MDSFFQALLGLRALCSRFDPSLDRLAQLPQGATSTWVRTGALPGEAEPATRESTPPDECVAIVLGALALRREIDRSFESIAQVPMVPSPEDAPARASDSSEEGLLR